jgi:hypothetical protein
MVDEDSPIIDFYPSTFEIDMNGKKMAWQGVALLPFIDERRLLDAMATQYPNLTDEEIGRNRWGDNVVYASDEHPLYPFFEQLFGKRKKPEVRLHCLPSHISSVNFIVACTPRYYSEQRHQRICHVQPGLLARFYLLLSSYRAGYARHQERSVAFSAILLPKEIDPAPINATARGKEATPCSLFGGPGSTEVWFTPTQFES